GCLLTLDYPGQRVLVTRGALPAPDGKEVFAWDSTAPIPDITIDVAGHPVRAHLDSGSGGSLTFPTTLAAKLPLNGDLVEIGRARMVGQERVIRGGELKGKVHIGRYRLENPKLRFMDDMAADGNVGSAVLRNFQVTVDPLRYRLRLSHPGGDV